VAILKKEFILEITTSGRAVLVTTKSDRHVQPGRPRDDMLYRYIEEANSAG